LILSIIESIDCHVVFCEDEELGAIGAREFSESGICPDVKYIIEFDRRGSNDAVFYDCDNPEFETFITSFGFETASGSFSDISDIAPALGVAAVNLSAGYFDEHTKRERIDLDIIENNISRSIELIKEPVSEQFKYIPRFKGGTAWYGYDAAAYKTACDCCGSPSDRFLYPAFTNAGEILICRECAGEHFTVCPQCGEYWRNECFIDGETGNDEYLCPACRHPEWDTNIKGNLYHGGFLLTQR
jgi:hypothetical protein